MQYEEYVGNLEKTVTEIREAGPGGIAVLRCLFEEREGAGLSRNELAELIGCDPGTLKSVLKQLTAARDSETCPLVRTSGQKRSTKYSISPTVEAAYFNMQNFGKHPGLIRAMALSYLKHSYDQRDISFKVPSSEVDLSQMVHPGFVLDEKLRVVGCSDSFLRLFNIEREELPIDALNLFSGLEHYDVLLEEKTGETLSSLLIERLQVGKPIDNYVFNYAPPGLKPLQLEAFIVLQKTRIGIQGTLINATSKLDYFRQLTAAAKDDTNFILEHEVGNKLAELHTELVLCRMAVEAELGEGNEIFTQIKHAGSLAGTIHDQLYESSSSFSDTNRPSAFNVVNGINKAIWRSKQIYPTADIKLGIEQAIKDKLVNAPSQRNMFITVIENLVRNSVEAALNENKPEPKVSVRIAVEGTGISNHVAQISILNPEAVEIPLDIQKLINIGDVESLEHKGRGLAKCVKWVSDIRDNPEDRTMIAKKDRMVIRLPVEIDDFGGADSIGEVPSGIPSSDP